MGVAEVIGGAALVGVGLMIGLAIVNDGQPDTLTTPTQPTVIAADGSRITIEVTDSGVTTVASTGTDDLGVHGAADDRAAGDDVAADHGRADHDRSSDHHAPLPGPTTTSTTSTTVPRARPGRRGGSGPATADSPRARPRQ